MSRTVLITGGTHGIGRACAERFHTSGWAVTVIARTEADLTALEKQLPGLRTVAADLATEAGVNAVPSAAYDALIFNAAAFRPGPILAPEQDLFEQLLPLNVLAHHRLARRLLPELVRRGSGHLVVVGSTGTDNWHANMTAYVATKYALRGLFHAWQTDLASTPVRCTLVAPGATLTRSWDGEPPPPGILQPTYVADEIYRAVREGRGGRLMLPSSGQEQKERPTLREEE